jgi:glycosyltransferase involved in cell wall biosynthesis
MAPLISVVMAARNAEGTIGAAIRSVLDQDLDDFELLVVDDRSEDRTAVIAAGFRDPRVRCLRTRDGEGRGAARNEAVAVAAGRLLAIADADDVSLPHRFAVQASYLAEHPEIHAVGAQIAAFGSWGGPVVRYRYPVDRRAVQARIQRHRMPLAHAAAMFRTDTVRVLGGYDTACVRCQDYELVLRLPPGSVAAADEVLVHYRSARYPQLAYCRENARYHRLARARAAAKLAGAVPPELAEIARLPRRVGWLVDDTARWLVGRMVEPLRTGRRLR